MFLWSQIPAESEAFSIPTILMRKALGLSRGQVHIPESGGPLDGDLTVPITRKLLRDDEREKEREREGSPQ